jgi:hypothetical protein
MPLATKNNAIIVKNGRLAENCDCCGDWYCVGPYGCCTTASGASSQKCEQECIDSNGVFSVAGAECCESFSPTTLPSSITVSVNAKPSIYGHGCIALDSGETVYDGDYSGSGDWTPLDVFSQNSWTSTVTLTRNTTEPAYPATRYPLAAAFYDNFGQGGDGFYAGAWVGCKYIDPATGVRVWNVLACFAYTASVLRLKTRRFGSFLPGYSRVVEWKSGATLGNSPFPAWELISNGTGRVSGDSLTGFSVQPAVGTYHTSNRLFGGPHVCGGSITDGLAAGPAAISSISMTL